MKKFVFPLICATVMAFTACSDDKDELNTEIYYSLAHARYEYTSDSGDFESIVFSGDNSTFSYAYSPKGKEGYILNVYTCPGFRRQGLAKLLLQEIIIYANNHDINKLWLNSSEYGKYLYSSLGFICKNDEMVLMLKN